MPYQYSLILSLTISYDYFSRPVKVLGFDLYCWLLATKSRRAIY